MEISRENDVPVAYCCLPGMRLSVPRTYLSVSPKLFSLCSRCHNQVRSGPGDLDGRYPSVQMPSLSSGRLGSREITCD